MKKIKNFNRGFTLVETLVAVSIFSMSILALMSVLASGISNTIYAKQKIIASYLAQEGIEYIRNMRDTFVLYDPAGTQVGWDAFKDTLTDAACQETSGCYFDDQRDQDGDSFNMYLSPDPQPITKILLESCAGDCQPLLYNEDTGKYGYDTPGVNSGFIRKIRMTTTESNINEVKIFSSVSWKQGSGTYSVTLSENLFNWVE